MEHDDRGRRDWPDDDTAAPADPSEPADASPSDADAARPDAEVTRHEEGGAPAEIESWPSQDATAQPGGFGTDAPGYEAPPESAAAWPAEAPPADSETADSWSTRSSEPYATPADEPPPSEVEAYPAAPVPEPVGTDAAAASTAAHAVPAAETATGESTQCPRCGTENRPGLAFCRECGQRLVAAGVSTTIERPGTPEGTQACPRCGTHNRAGVAFCQNCGANLRGTAPGYVPPSVAEDEGAAVVERERRGAVLGPVVLLIGLVGLITGYLLPFAYGSGSLFDRAFGSGGYGIGFWDGYPEVGAALADQAYFGLAAPVLLLGLLLVALAVAGFMRAAPGMLQTIGLVVALLWSVGLVLLFLVVELVSNWDGDLVGLLRVLTPAGIIFFLSGLIILIGVLTRFGRS